MDARKDDTEDCLQHMNSEGFCPVPWVHISMTNNGAYRACCDINEKPWGILGFNAKTDETAKVRNAAVLRELRASMVKGERHKMCGQCWQREDQGLDSRREMFLRMYPEVENVAKEKTSAAGEISPADFPLRNLDLRFGNKCNLSCRTCQPADSSLKMHEWLEKNGGFSYYGEIYNSGAPFVWTGDAVLFADIMKNAENLHQLYITGGEPLINEEHWRLLEQLVESGHSAHIHLVYNSNVIFLPRIAGQIWPKFKSVDVACSIDGVGAVAEFIRPPTVWGKVEQNLRALDEMPEHVRFSIAPTISVLNIAHLPELDRWLQNSQFKKCAPELGTHLLFFPEWYSIQVLSQTAKSKVRKKLGAKFAGVLNHMDQEDKSALLPRLIQETENLRGLPELAELILE